MEMLRTANRYFPLQEEYVDLLTIRRYARSTTKAYTVALLVANDYMLEKENCFNTLLRKKKFQTLRYESRGFLFCGDCEVVLSQIDHSRLIFVRLARFLFFWFEVTVELF